LVFGASDPKFGAVKSVFNILDHKQLNHKILYESGVLAEESAALLTSFFKKRR
jgi:tRNA(adenine34) deaminase